MTWKLGLIATALVLGITSRTTAQYVLPPFPYGSPTARFSAFYSGGASFGFAPFGLRRFGYSSFSGGMMQQAVILRPVIIAPAAPPPDYDLSGIDLDVESPDRLFGKAGGPAAPRRGGRVPEKAVMPRDVAAKPAPVKPPAIAPAPAPPGKLPPPMPEVRKPPADELLQPRAKPADESQRLAELGLRAFRNQEYGLAVFRFRQAAERDPTNARAFFLLGQAYLAVGQLRDAARAIHNGLRLQPDWPARDFRPRTELYADHVADWLEHRRRVDDAVKRQPLDAAYLFLSAYAAWFDGQRPQAVEQFHRARALATDVQWIDLFLKHAPAIPVAGK